MKIEWNDLINEAQRGGSPLELMLHLYKAGWKVVGGYSFDMELKAKNGWTYTFQGQHFVSPAHLNIYVPNPPDGDVPRLMVEMEIYHTMRLKDFKVFKAKAEAKVREKIAAGDWYTYKMTDC